MAPGAPAEEVRSAYRASVRALHPDSRDPTVPAADADAALRRLNDAWEVLGDPRRRADYDEGLEESAFDADGEPWASTTIHGRRFPWWILALAILLVIFVFTAYAGAPAPSPPAR